MTKAMLASEPLAGGAARSYWESNSFKYDCVHDRLRLVAREIAALAPSSILDLGCSTGRLARELQASLPEMNYFGCDLSLAAVERIDLPRVVQRDLNEDGLPFGGLRFDCIAASGICEYIVDLPGLLGEVCCRLNPRGWFVASYLNTWHAKRLARVLAGRPPACNPCWQKLMSPVGFERLLLASGFTIHRRLAARGKIKAVRGGTTSRIADAWRRAWPRITPLAHLLAHQLVYVCQRRS
jgi:SAM-dependent methyltransferase